MLEVGSKFSSFAEVKKAIAELGEETFTTFWKRDARTIASSNIVRPIESSLIYYQLVYACNHGGRKFQSRGKNMRQSWTFKENCPVHVRLKATGDGKFLEVTSFENKHNHDNSKVLSQRRLPSDVKDFLKTTMADYKDKQRTLKNTLLETEPTEDDLQDTSINNIVSTQPHQPLNTYSQRRKKCLLLCTELADLAAQRTGMLFEQRLNILKKLKTLWANDVSVAISPIDVKDQNEMQFTNTINGNDEIEFININQLPLDPLELDSEMIPQETNEVFNTDSLQLQHLEVPEVNETATILNQEQSNLLDIKEEIEELTEEVPLNEDNELSHQTIATNDMALTTIKMPVSIKKRRRPKEQDLTVIGLPKKKKRKAMEFSKKPYEEKQKLILNFFVNDDIVKDIQNGKIIEESEIKTISENVPHSVLDEAVDIHLIRQFCTDKAFQRIVNLVEQKRLQKSWDCPVCSQDTQKNNTALRCSGCLVWRHIRCAGLSREPKSKFWFCRECCL